jgi:NCAIR mutase (PurE)-related protein
MDTSSLRELLEDVKNGRIVPEAAAEKIKRLTFHDLGFAKVDIHRSLRQGFPEVIYCAGKTTEQVVSIISVLAGNHKNILATRANRSIFESVRTVLPMAYFHEIPGLISIQTEKPEPVGSILIVCAGTSDLPVAEEAAVTAEIMGNRVERLYDAGVAGIHRLLLNEDKLNSARVIVVVAGMEGALASVVGGLVDKPVIAVPTSIGYGASFHGLAALLSMLNSCANGVTVVNIDNGFGAGYAASLINKINETA